MDKPPRVRPLASCLVACLWLCTLLVSASGSEDGADHDVSLDSADGPSLGESLGSTTHGYYCTPKGQMSPGYAYSDKDCLADGKTQQCGEVWCCGHENGKEVYSCSREHRAPLANCAGKKPVCSGPKPTGGEAVKSSSSSTACHDTHDAICEAAKAYGHCKHSSYASECPHSCGACGLATASDSAMPASVKSVIAQVKEEEDVKDLDKSDDAREVAKSSAIKMNKRAADADRASDTVARQEEEVANAKRKVEEVEVADAAALRKAGNAGKIFLKRVKKRAEAKLKMGAAAQADLDRKIRNDERNLASTRANLKATRALSDGKTAHSAGVFEAKAQLAQAIQAKRTAEKQIATDKAMTAKAGNAAKTRLMASKGAVSDSMKILIKAKDARADISNEVSDALARVNELRGQVRGEGPDESQVLSIRNKLEKSEQHLHRTEEAADTVSVQKTKAQRQVQADGSQVSTARAAVKTAVEDAEDDGKQNTAKLAKKLEKQDQKHEETKLEEKAVMKVEELAIEHKKGQALREEEKEKTIFTDADMKAKSEAAFLRTERKVDQIFDNIKPLVLNLAKSPAAMEQEGSATGVKSIVESEGTQASGEGETRLLMDNMLKSKEMMHAAEVRIHKLQRVVDDGSLNAHAPKKLLEEAKEEAKREADKIGQEQGSMEARKLGKVQEKAAVSTAKSKAQKLVDVAVKAENTDNTQEMDIESHEAEVQAKLQGRTADVKDLKEDVQMAEKQMKRDDIPKKEIVASQQALRTSKQKIRAADRSVRSARSAHRSAQETMKSDRQEIHQEEQAAEKKIEDIESKAENKADKAYMAVENARSNLKLEKDKKAGVMRIQARIKRLTTEYKEEQGMTRSVKRERRKVNKRTRKLQTDADQKVAKAEDQMATITERAVNLAKVNGERAVAAAQAALADVQRVLEEGKKAQEATASVASAKVKMCKELVQPTMTSKDEAALCSVVKEEQHCSFFDYARYCAKSCGTCVL